LSKYPALGRVKVGMIWQMAVRRQLVGEIDMLKLYVATQEKLLALKEDISGATAIEYGLIAAGISIAILAGVQLIGPQLAALFARISAALG